MKNIVLLILLFIASVAQAARISDNKVKLGNSTSTGNKTIEFDTGAATNKKIELDASTGDLSATSNNLTLGDGASGDKKIIFNRGGSNATIKWDETTGKLKFAKDGATFKDFGSGSGSGDGGLNLLTNPGFEDAIAGVLSGVTNSGGTLSQQTFANGGEGDLSYLRFVATTSGQYFETSLVTVPTFGVGGCLGKVNFNTADSANWKIQIYDNAGTPNLLKEEPLYIKSWQDGFASFPCPSAGTQIKIRVISLGAGTFEANNAYLGKENRTYQIPNSKLMGTLAFPSGCTGWSVSNAGSYTSMSTNALCANPVIVGVLKAGSTTAPSFTLPAGSSKGTYKVTLQGEITASSGVPTTTNCAFRLFDGTNGYLMGNVRHVSNNSTNITTGVPVISSTITITSDLAVDTNYIVQAYNADGANSNRSCNITVSGSYGPQFTVEYLGDATKTALVPEAQDWFIDVNIGGGSPSLGIAGVTSYTELANASLDMVLNTGSASAKIPCTGTNAATGLTCSGGTTTESLGVNFVNPTVGYYEVCMGFTHTISAGATGSANSDFQIVQTQNASQTILQEGKQRTESAAPQNFSGSFPHYNCGTFYFSDVSEKTVRLMYEQSVSGTLTQSVIFADRAANNGQRDIHVVVRPFLSASNRPYLTGDQVTTPSALKPVIFSGLINTTTGAVTNNKGGILPASCTITPVAGAATCTFAVTLASAPACTFGGTKNQDNTNDSAQCNIESGSQPTTTTLKIITHQAAARTGNFCNVICHGEKQ